MSCFAHLCGLQRYPVSNFAKDLLQSIFSDPLYDISAVSKGALYRQKPVLAQARQCRIELKMLREYMHTCRSGSSLLSAIDASSHLATEPNVYSLEELVSIKQGVGVPALQSLIKQCIEHVTQCPLCMAKGFYCELCRSDEILFPFMKEKISRCEACNDVFHQKCWSVVSNRENDAFCLRTVLLLY